MISNCKQINPTLFYTAPPAVEPEEAARVADGFLLPCFSVYDRALWESIQKGVADKRGMIRKERAPDTLPPLPEEESSDILRTFRFPHSMLTKKRCCFFDLSLPEFLQTVLSELHTSYTTYLVGGAIFAFFNEEYTKEVLGRLHGDLFDSLPKECLQFNKIPNDYDFRIYINGNFTYQHFVQLKINIINALVGALYGKAPFHYPRWMELYKFALDNCFVKFKIEFSEKNRFLITTFTDGRTTIDLLWIASLERPYLFTNNSLSQYIPNIQRGASTTPLMVPIGESGNGYQAVHDKIAKIIHAADLHTINYKGWFTLLYQQTAFYRCYEEHLEQALLQTALSHPTKKDRAEWCEEILKQCLYYHLDKDKDPVALFCLVFSACRSLHQLGHHELALKLYARSQAAFPRDGLPSLIDPSFDAHLALLMLFGLMAHDGKSVCYTMNEFKPALQFVLKGKAKSFTLLIPLQIEKALNTPVENVDRYFAHFFPGKESYFSTTPLNIKLPELGEPSNRLLYYLIIWDSLQRQDFSAVQKVVAAFPKLYAESPSGHLISITEKFLQGFLKNPSFSFGKEWSSFAFASALFSQNNPLLTYQAQLYWEGQRLESGFKENTEKLLHKMPLSYRIKQIQTMSLFGHIPTLVNLLVKSLEGITCLPDCFDLIMETPDPDAESIALFIDHYLNTFGFSPKIYSLLAKKGITGITYLKTAASHPAEAEKIWQLGKERLVFTEGQEAELLCQIILRFIKLRENEKAALLLPLLNRKLIGKAEQKQIAQFIETQADDPALMILELERALQERQFAQIPKYLDALLSLGDARLVRQILSLPKQPELTAKMLRHPNIRQILTPQEILQAVTKNPAHFEIGVEIFPSGESATDRAFIELIIKRNLAAPPKLAHYVFELGDAALIEQWINLNQQLSQEHLQRYLNLPGASSPLIRKYTTKESLEALGAEYRAYIPTVSNEERFAWICLILEVKLAGLYPVASWMEGVPLTRPLLTLCAEAPFVGLQTRLKSGVYAPDDLSLAAALFRRFDLFDPPAMMAFLTEALNASSERFKIEMWEHFESLCKEMDAECWILAVKLLRQIKSEKLFDLMGKTLPQSPQLCKEIAEGAAQLIKDPKNEAPRIASLLLWRGKHNLEDDAKILILCANSRHTPLLMESMVRLNKLFIQFPTRIGELLQAFECVLKNVPVEGGKPLLYLLGDSLLENIPFTHMNLEFFLTLIRTMCRIPREDVLMKMCDLIHCLLTREIKQGDKTIAGALKLCIQSQSIELHKKALMCLNHPHFSTVVADNKSLYFDLLEKMLMHANESLIVDTTILFYACLSELPPEREKKIIQLFIDYILHLPANPGACFYIVLLFKQMSQRKTGMTKQAQKYYGGLGHPVKPSGNLKSNPHDLLFEIVSYFLKNIINRPGAWIDADINIYKYVHLHLFNLIENYPENGQIIIPLLYKWLTLQLPSGFDLSANCLTRSSEMLIKACKIPAIFNDHLEELHELAFINATQVSHTAETLPIKQKAFKNVIFRLTQHPSQLGPYRACQLIEKNSEFFSTLADKTIRFLLGALEDSILKDPSLTVGRENIKQQYLSAVICLMRYKPALQAHLMQFFKKLFHTLQSGPKAELAAESLNLANLTLICAIAINNYPLMVENLSLIGEFLVKNAPDAPILYSQVGQILDASLDEEIDGYEKKYSDKLIEKIFSSLRANPLPGMQELLSQTPDKSVVRKVIALLKKDK